MEFIDNGLRRSLRRKHPVPDIDLHVLQSAFGRCRHIGKRRGALRRGHGDIDRVEIHLVAGALTAVAASAPGMDTPSMLVDRGALTQAQVDKLARCALERDRTADSLAVELFGVDLTMLRRELMLERLRYLLTWPDGLYAFSAAVPEATSSIAPSAIHILVPLIASAFSLEALRGRLAPHLHTVFVASPGLEPALRQMGLSPSEQQLAHALVAGESAGSVLSRASDQAFAVALAHVLIELGLLRVRTGAVHGRSA